MQANRLASAIPASCLVAVLLFSVGCDEHLPEIIDQSLSTLSSDENISRLRKLTVEVPALRMAAKELTLGVLEAIDEDPGLEDRTLKLQESSIEFVAAISAAVARAANEELGEAVREQLVASVNEVMAAALTHESLPDLTITAAAIGEATTLAIMEGLAEGLDSHLAPALARTFDEHVGPALTATLSDSTPVLGAAAREAAYQAVLGANDALIEALRDEQLRIALEETTRRVLVPVEEVLDEARTAADRWRMTLIALAVVLGLVVAILVILYYRRQAKRREETVQMIATAIRKADDAERRDPAARPGTSADKVLDELRTVRHQFAAGRHFLDDFLEKHPELRVERDHEGEPS